MRPSREREKEARQEMALAVNILRSEFDKPVFPVIGAKQRDPRWVDAVYSLVTDDRFLLKGRIITTILSLPVQYSVPILEVLNYDPPYNRGTPIVIYCTLKNITGAPVKLYTGQEEVQVFDRFTNPNRYGADPRFEVDLNDPVFLKGNQAIEMEHELAIHALHSYCRETVPPSAWSKWAHERDALREIEYYVVRGKDVTRKPEIVEEYEPEVVIEEPKEPMFRIFDPDKVEEEPKNEEDPSDKEKPLNPYRSRSKKK